MRKGGRIKIYWTDAVIYKAHRGGAFPRPTKMLTHGKLAKEGRDYYLIANPLTEKYDEKLHEFVPKPYIEGENFKEATFFYIPKGMVDAIVKL